MAEDRRRIIPSDRDKAPGVDPKLKSSVDASYDPAQDGSVPLETVSVKRGEERSFWPIVWAVTVILMILLTIYLFVG